MKQNAPPSGNSAARVTGASIITSVLAITPKTAPAQESIEAQLANGGIHLAAIWRSPRDRSRAIQFSLRQFNGHEFLDIRQYEASSGYMIPTNKGLTISIAQLGKFADAAGKAYRRAVALGLVTATARSS